MAEVLELDPAALTDVSADALEPALGSWSATVAASEFRWLRLVAEHDRRRLDERWECRTCAHWLMWHCALDIRAAHENVRVARALEHLPLVAAAFERGELSYSKVRAISRVAHPDPHAIRPHWIDQPRFPSIISVCADPPRPDPRWN